MVIISTNLIVVLCSQYSREEALNHIKHMSKHKSPARSNRQIIFPEHHMDLPALRLKPRQRSKPNPFMRKGTEPVNENDVLEPSWLKMVSGAHKFVIDNHVPEAKIVLLGISGDIVDDFSIVNAMMIELTNQLDASRIEASCIAHIHRDRKEGIFDLNNRFLQAAPLSVKHIFNFNWQSGKESYCSTMRDSIGRVISRETCFYKADGYHYPLVMHATMNFIRYQSKFTQNWSNLPPGKRIICSTGFSAFEAQHAYVPTAYIAPPTNSEPEVQHLCTKPFGMVAYDIFEHLPFRKPNESFHLPSRMVWRSVYN
ncbi:unnamed protein product [Rhizoctonia solani]|uniref:Uncharacterized protein n=1 Tax=Rhizoctonia solani TaxID=456999 RepID=A0A8H3C4R4_9AGAM|nr:unnamed protein product [Rhizoctonia solani]